MLDRLRDYKTCPCRVRRGSTVYPLEYSCGVGTYNKNVCANSVVHMSPEIDPGETRVPSTRATCVESISMLLAIYCMEYGPSHAPYPPINLTV